MDLKLVAIHKIVDDIISEVNSFIEVTPVGTTEEEIKNIELLKNFSDSLLPSIKIELTNSKEILSETIMTNIILDGLNSLEDKINSIILSNDKNYIKLRKLVNQSYNLYNIRRDFRIFRALSSNYSKKIDNLEKKLLSDNKEKFENEIRIIKDNFKQYLDERKQKYESEIKELRLQVNAICENSDKTLGTIFRSYEKDFKGMESVQFEETRNRSKAFNEFMDELSSIRDGLIDRFDSSYNKIQSDWKKIQQIKTENVYLNAYHKNTARSKNSEKKFIGVTVLSLMLSLLTIIAFIFRAIDFSQFISIKIMIVVFFGILIAYYLRISTHYRRLADQAEQTHLELLAFPQYAAELGEEKSREIKEQLALKYFGKEIDASGYQKISDVAQEQLKTSSELVKAAASLSVASTKTNQSSINNKPQNNTNQSETNGG